MAVGGGIQTMELGQAGPMNYSFLGGLFFPSLVLKALTKFAVNMEEN